MIRNVAVPVEQDADTLTESYTVHVQTEPLPPVEVTIDGPTFIQPHTDYTWTASVSGGSGSTTYSWYRAEDTGSGPGPWEWVSGSSSYTGRDVDCHGFELKLEVTREFPSPGQNSDTDIVTITVDDGGGTECIMGIG